MKKNNLLNDVLKKCIYFFVKIEEKLESMWTATNTKRTNEKWTDHIMGITGVYFAYRKTGQKLISETFTKKWTEKNTQTTGT